jgi:hypothetical protein
MLHYRPWTIDWDVDDPDLEIIVDPDRHHIQIQQRRDERVVQDRQ